MVLYRRARVAGASYFFTLALADRRQDLLTRHIDLLRECFRQAQLRRPFHIDTVVILPEHLHLVMSLPAGDQDYAARIGQLKVLFTRGLRAGGMAVAANAPREAGIWQPRYWGMCYVMSGTSLRTSTTSISIRSSMAWCSG
ncbi:MAG TPA: transposase [Pseudomonas sp.]|nr:transposase [Pseudomonas sp.]